MILTVDHAVYSPVMIVSLRKESANLSLLNEQIYAVYARKLVIKRSPLYSGYKPESFFYTRPAIEIKMPESTTSAAKPAIKPAVKPAIKPAAKPAIEPAQRRSTRKRKRD